MTRRADEPIRVAVIGGGRNCEHAVSLASAAAVVAALDPVRYTPVALTIDTDGRWLDHAGHVIGFAAAAATLETCAVAIPMLHGPHGEDGTLAALCDLAGVPVVGSGVGAAAIAMDKWATRLVASAAGIATAPGLLLDRSTVGAYRFRGPVVVKPVSAGSSRGVRRADDAGEFESAIADAFRFADRVLVEDVVHGREIDLAVVGRPDGSRLVAPALEIVGAGVFDYATKYGGHAPFVVPAPLTDAEGTGLEGAAVTVYDALGCAGLARIDFFLTAAGPVLIEVNTTPGFTPQSQVPRMFAAAGTSYPELLDLLIADVMSPSARTGRDGSAAA